MTFSTNVDVTPFNETFLIVVKISSMTWKFNSVIDSQRGSFALWFLNPILAGGMLFVEGIINGLLAGGIDINWLISEILGTDIFYFEAFTLSQDEELLFAKLTPALRLKQLKIPNSLANFKVPGFGGLLTKIA